MTATLRLAPRTIAFVLTLIALLLAILSFVLEAYEWSLGINNTYWVLEASDLFNVTFEGNIPTFFSVLLLLFAAVLCGFIAAYAMQNKQGGRFHWLGMTVLFSYLAMDEAAAIHEIFTTPMRELFNATDYLYFAWIIVFIPLLLIIGLLLLPFVLKLPTHTRLTLFLALVFYFLGSVVGDAIGAKLWYETDGLVTPRYTAIGGVEEFLEMFGVILVIYALLTYIAAQIGTVMLTFEQNQAKKEPDTP